IHAQGLVHRDVKPANMMLVGAAPDSTLRATLKILDIGLGRTLFEEGGGDGSDAALTTEGVLLGTPDYMSPEQARDPRQSDIRSDIYSLGCVLYHLLAGQPPFPDTNIISQMIRHATETAKPIKSFNAAVPDGLQQIVNWMMAKDPSQRYPTPDRAAQALQVFLASSNDRLDSPESNPNMKPYLSWLEESGKQAVVNAAPPAAKSAPPPLPRNKPSKERPPAADAPGSPGDGARLSRSGKRRKKKHHPPPTPGAVDASINVELVPVDSPPTAKIAKIARLSRRDVLLFGIGALLGATVTFVGALLAFKRH
ncbi:MAG: serine/threonine-protein kinase, partial [Gemmataceae bacterium]